MNRHDLIYLHPDHTFTFLDHSLPLPVQQKIQHMIQHHMPFTVCRQESEDYFKVAANCFVHERKYRVAIALSCTPSLSHKPILLSKVTKSLDLQTQHLLQQFIQQMEKCSCSVYVYGSYANEYLYQEKFVHAQSDLDLLIESNNTEKVLEMIQFIKQLKMQLPISIDGEIALPKGQNISFNELIFALEHGQDSIIVKELNDIRLQSITEIFGRSLYELQQYHHSFA